MKLEFRKKGTTGPARSEEKLAGVELDRVAGFLSGIDKTDLWLAVFVSFVVSAFFSVFSFRTLHPDFWGPAAIALKTRPPELPVLGVWTFSARSICGLLGADTGILVLKALGWLMGGMLAGIAYVLLRVVFSTRYALLPNELSPIIGRLRTLSLVGALVFACSDPVWRMCQFFTGELLHIALAGLAVCSFWLYWRTGRMSLFCSSFVFSGILTAETPVGLVFSVGCFLINEIARIKYSMTPHESAGFSRAVEIGATDADPGDIDNEITQEVGMTEASLENWAFCVFFFFTLISVLLLDGWLFRIMGGMEVKHLGGWDYPMILASTWIGQVKNVISADDLLAASAFSLVPFLLARSLMPVATNAKSRLAFPLGWLVSAMGLVAYTQLGPWAKLWYWSWDVWRAAVPSSTVQVVLAFFAAAAVTASFEVVCCACRRRTLGVDTIAVSEIRMHVWLRDFGTFVLAVVAAAVTMLGVVGRIQPDVNRRLSVIAAYARQMVADIGDARWVFTDGAYDDCLRMLLQKAGSEALPVSVMSGHHPYETYLRVCAAKDAEDIPMLEASGAEAIRFWIGEKPEHMAKSAIQVGFDVLRKCKFRPPRTAGLVMRTALTPEDDKAFDHADLEAASFSTNVLETLGKDPGLLGGFDRSVNEKIDFMLWRLSRMAEQRAFRASRMENADNLVVFRKQAQDLDAANRSLQVLKGKLERLKPSEGIVLTPREGLEVCLKRADFNLARHYAEMVLRVDDRDPTAAFALAMWLLENREYARAAKYFELSLERRPNELASLNNLALSYFKHDEFDKALETATRAAKLYPESKDVQRNLERIRKTAEEIKRGRAD